MKFAPRRNNYHILAQSAEIFWTYIGKRAQKPKKIAHKMGRKNMLPPNLFWAGKNHHFKKKGRKNGPKMHPRFLGTYTRKIAKFAIFGQKMPIPGFTGRGGEFFANSRN